MSLLDHRRIIGASDLEGYAKTVVTEEMAGGYAVFLDERAGLGLARDLFKSVICECKSSSSV